MTGQKGLEAAILELKDCQTSQSRRLQNPPIHLRRNGQETTSAQARTFLHEAAYTLRNLPLQ